MLANGHAWDLPAGTHGVTRPIDKETLFLPDGRRALVFVRRTPHPRATYVPELREIGSGQTLHRFPAVDSSIRVALSGDGQRVAVLDGALSVFSTETFERVAQVTDLEGAGWVHLSHDGRRAVVETLSCISLLGGGAGSAPRCPPPHLAVWDLDRTERIFRGERGAGNGWVFTRDGRFLTGPETRLVDAIIRVEDGAVLQYGTRIRSISPDARWVLFDAQSGLDLASLDGSGAPPPLSRALRVLARSGDGRFTAGVGADGMLRLEGATTCVRLGMTTGVWRGPRSPYDHLDPKDDQVTFSPDGASLFTVIHDTSRPLFRAFRTSDGTERWSIRAAGRGEAAAYVLPGAGQLLFQGYGRAEVRRFDATTGAELPAGHAPRVGDETPTFGGATFDVRDPEGARASHLVIPAATRDGRSVATLAHLNNAFMFSIWDLQDPRRVVDLPAGGLPVRLALSPDERWWAAGTMDGGLRLFPRQGGRPLDASSGHAGRVTALVFTKAGDRLASAAEDGTVVLVDPSSGAVVGRARLPLDRAESLWVSPDGRELWAETARAMRVRFRIRRAASEVH
jgi:WD40 repeat protein